MREGSRTSLPSPHLLFIAFFALHRSPLSERLEQAKKYRGRGLSVLTAREMKREPKSERGGRGRVRKETFLPHPSPLFYLRHFSRGL